MSVRNASSSIYSNIINTLNWSLMSINSHLGNDDIIPGTARNKISEEAEVINKTHATKKGTYRFDCFRSSPAARRLEVLLFLG